jgi:hypothetical protein
VNTFTSSKNKARGLRQADIGAAQAAREALQEAVSQRQSPVKPMQVASFAANDRRRLSATSEEEKESRERRAWAFSELYEQEGRRQRLGTQPTATHVARQVKRRELFLSASEEFLAEVSPAKR